MKYYIIEIVNKESQKVEAAVGERLNSYYMEKTIDDLKQVVDLEKYELVPISLF